MKLKKRLSIFINRHRAALEYRHIENKDTYNLVQRVTDSPQEKITDTLKHFVAIAYVVIRFSLTVYVISVAGWWIGFILVLISIHTVIVGYRGGRYAEMFSAQSAWYI